MRTISKILFALTIAIPISSCSGTGNKSMNESFLKHSNKLIDSTVKQYFQEDQPGLSIIIWKDGETIFKEAYGLSNVEHSIPATPSTLYKIGSVTKQFTAVSIMILKERGLLSLDDSLGIYFKNLEERKRAITIKQLLEHSSGIKNHNEIDLWKSRVRIPISKEDLIRTFINEPLYFDPGTDYHYSNSGYVLLGAIIEIITGQDFESFVTENIFNPLEMENTFISNDSLIYPEMATGYRVENYLLLKSSYMSMSHTYASGSIITNTEDLTRWISGLRLNRLISSKSFTYCLENSFGWFPSELDSKQLFSMGGGVYGFVSYTAYLPSEGIYLAILSNCVDTQPTIQKQLLGEILMEIALGIKQQKDEMFFVKVDLPENALERYSGSYRFDTGGRRKITIDNGRVFYEIPPMNEGNPWTKNEIIPASDSVFFVNNKKTYISFQIDSNGVVTGLTVNQPFGRKKVLIKEDK